MVRRSAVVSLLLAGIGALGIALAVMPGAQATTVAPGSAVAAAAAGDTSPPTAPTNLRAAVSCPLQVTLSWTASSDDVGVVGYDVFRAQGTNPFVLAGTTTTTTFTETISGTRYQVRARDAAGNVSAFSAAVTVLPPPCPTLPPPSTPPPPDTTPPTTPGAPTATVSCGSSTFTWPPATDNVRVVAYEVFEAPGASGNQFVLVATVSTNSYTQTGAGFFRFEVRARDAAGNVSPFTAPISVAVPACPSTSTPPPPAGCTASYTQVSAWGDGFQGQVTVTNTGTNATTGWTVTLTFANGQAITQLWGARTISTASPYVLANDTYNGVLDPNASTSFGFLASWRGTNAPPTVSCTRTP